MDKETEQRILTVLESLQRDMAEFKATQAANLDNGISPMNGTPKGEHDMSKKICRPVTINGRKRWISGNTEQEYADALMAAYGGNLPGQQQEGHPFNEWIQKYYCEFIRHEQDGQKHTNDITMERMMRLHILPIFEGLDVEDVTPAHVQKMIRAMKGAAESKKKPLALVRRALDYAVEKRIIPFNPAKSSSIKLEGSKSKATEPYSVEEMRYFVSHLQTVTNPSDRNWLALITSNVLRPEEVLGIRGEDIDLKTGKLFVHSTVTHPDRNQPVVKDETKTEKSTRWLIIDQETLKQLTTVGADEWLVGKEHPLSYSMVTRMCRRIEREISSPVRITPRRFRTTCATDLYEQTKDLKP